MHGRFRSLDVSRAGYSGGHLVAVVQDGVSLKTRKEGLLGLGGACVSLFLYVYIVYIYIHIYTHEDEPIP